jgi:hypothetical protein
MPAEEIAQAAHLVMLLETEVTEEDDGRPAKRSKVDAHGEEDEEYEDEMGVDEEEKCAAAKKVSTGPFSFFWQRLCSGQALVSFVNFGLGLGLCHCGLVSTAQALVAADARGKVHDFLSRYLLHLRFA